MGMCVNIIFVSSRFTKARTLCVDRCQTGVLLAGGLMLFILMSGLFGYLILFQFGGLQVPLVQKLLISSQQTETAKNREAMQQRLSAMAIKVGEMQAQVMRLEALGERVAKVAGIKKEEINFDRKPGRGGMFKPGESVSLGDFEGELSKLARVLDDRTDHLAVLDGMLSRECVGRAALRTPSPISVGGCC